MEELLFVCPTCNYTLTPPEEGWSCDCGRCGRHVDLTGQFAYVRGFQAFEEAAEVMEGLKDAKKLKELRHYYVDTENQGFLLFEEAYSSLQEAFRYELAERQHQHGVKMMISIVQLFTPRNMVSGLEASYWNSMMVEQVARSELVKIEASFASASEQKLSWFTRLRWQLRRGQLKRELSRLDRQIRGIEKGLKLAHNFHPYRGRS